MKGTIYMADSVIKVREGRSWDSTVLSNVRLLDSWDAIVKFRKYSMLLSCLLRKRYYHHLLLRLCHPSWPLSHLPSDFSAVVFQRLYCHPPPEHRHHHCYHSFHQLLHFPGVSNKRLNLPHPLPSIPVCCEVATFRIAEHHLAFVIPSIRVVVFLLDDNTVL